MVANRFTVKDKILGTRKGAGEVAAVWNPSPEAEGVLVTLPRNNVNYAYEFTINHVTVDLKKGTIAVRPEETEVVQNIGLAFATATLYLLVQSGQEQNQGKSGKQGQQLEEFQAGKGPPAKAGGGGRRGSENWNDLTFLDYCGGSNFIVGWLLLR